MKSGPLSERLAVFAIDPGTTTGIAWLLGPASAEDVPGVVRRADLYGSSLVRGNQLAQARDLARRWQAFRRHAAFDMGIPPDQHQLVIEDFILIKFNSSEKTGIDPVRMTAAFLGYRAGQADYDELHGGVIRDVEPIYQSPSDAMTFATDRRLRRWGMWDCPQKGRDKNHIRDARRHLALRIHRGLK